MNIKDIISDSLRDKPRIFNQDSYTSIYKKTEKIVCAVFLITDTIKEENDHQGLSRSIRVTATETLMTVTSFLSATKNERGAEDVVFARLMQLRSMLHVLVASRLVRAELVQILVREIDGVITNVHRALYDSEGALFSEVIEERPQFLDKGDQTIFKAPKMRMSGQATGGQIVRQKTPRNDNRRESILSIIRARGVVSIKDISDSITDCSEKTIQRELIDMVKDNVISKTGERRWSRYSIKSNVPPR